MKVFKKFLLFLFIALIFCAKIPPHVGKSRDVIVISAQRNPGIITENIQISNYMPQKENLFQFVFVHDSLTEKYNKFHTLFLYGTLEDEFIRVLLNDEAEESTRTDTFTLFKLQNLWAKGQLAIILAVTESEYLEAGIKKYRNLIVKILEENYYERIKENYYQKRMHGSLPKTLAQFGISLDFDDQWLLDTTFVDQHFIFAHTHFPDRSIFFYTEKLSEPLTDSLIIIKRNILTKKFYNGDYILTDLTTVERIEFKEMQGIRVKGVWQNDSLIAGGPFLSYFLMRKDSLYIIDAMLFNPGERKTEFFTALEVILNSFEFVAQ